MLVSSDNNNHKNVFQKNMLNIASVNLGVKAYVQSRSYFFIVPFWLFQNSASVHYHGSKTIILKKEHQFQGKVSCSHLIFKVLTLLKLLLVCHVLLLSRVYREYYNSLYYDNIMSSQSECSQIFKRSQKRHSARNNLI